MYQKATMQQVYSWHSKVIQNRRVRQVAIQIHQTWQIRLKLDSGRIGG